MDSPIHIPPTLPQDALPTLACGRGFALLDGVRVLDLTTSIAGPYGAMMLADMGADVVKVERPGAGDDARAWGPPFLAGQSLWFLSVNRNKRMLALDYGTPAGRAVLDEMIAAADVLLVNLPARTLAKLGLAPAEVRARHPRLVFVSITGFGLAGERADWTCYDLIAEGYSGVMDLTGEIDTDPQKVGAPAADMLAGMDAAFAAVAALHDRARTGHGHLVDIALVDSMTRFLTCRIVPYLGSGELPRRSGGKDSVIAIYQAFETADAPMTLGLGNDNLWRRFWAAVGRPERAEAAADGSNAARRARRAEIVAEIQEILRTRPRSHWLEVLAAARVPAGPINRVDEATRDGELLGRGLFYRLDSDDGPVPQVGTGIQVDGRANVPQRPPGRIGADTRDVLRSWLGYDDGRLDGLARDTTI
ncbi:MAG: CaiB/BaiF CoA transferase family protein [Hyphomicrobiaceae bacterium]